MSWYPFLSCVQVVWCQWLYALCYRARSWKWMRTLLWINFVHHLYDSLNPFRDWAKKCYTPWKQKSESMQKESLVSAQGQSDYITIVSSGKMWRWLLEVTAKKVHHQHNAMVTMFSLPSLWSIMYQEALHQVRDVNGQGIQHLSSHAS